MRHSRFVTAVLTVFAISLSTTGCATRSAHYATSVVQYLYPKDTKHVETATIPLLSLPLRVGVAFVPGDGYQIINSLSEKYKEDLMKKVSAEFKQYPFVKSIEIIPSPYLMPKGGFTNLDQLRTMYGVDVIALLSYDQVQHTDEGLLSLSYWTLIGAYIVRGEKNDTSTMLDAAVYHIPSRKLLFRAPGTSRIKASATPVNLREQLRKDSEAGFKEAAVMLTTNLKEQLEQFKVKVKESPQEYKIEHKAGYTGGGSLDPVALGLVAAFGGALFWSGRKRKGL